MATFGGYVERGTYMIGRFTVVGELLRVAGVSEVVAGVVAEVMVVRL